MFLYLILMSIFVSWYLIFLEETSMKLVIVRDYKTKSTTQELIMGWSDAEPEEDFAEDLYYVESRLLISNYDLEAVWSSELNRARRTAKFSE